MYCNFSSMHITYFSTWLGMHYNLSSTLSLYSTKQFLLLFVIFDLCMLNSAIAPDLNTFCHACIFVLCVTVEYISVCDLL